MEVASRRRKPVEQGIEPERLAPRMSIFIFLCSFLVFLMDMAERRELEWQTNQIPV
jgi:hypothetical protein